MNPHRTAWLFLMPALLVLGIFFLLPVIAALGLSLTDYDLYALANIHNLRFVGLHNYWALLHRPLFWTALGNTFYFVAVGVPRELAERVVTFDTLHAALDIAEVAADAKKPVEPVAAVYFDIANRLGLAWLRERVAALPGGAHWRNLAKGAMQDDLSALTRTIAANVVAGGGDVNATASVIGAWKDRNRRALERAAQLMTELRAVAAPDAAMLSVALRELRALT